jgi:hypothetical protein
VWLYWTRRPGVAAQLDASEQRAEIARPPVLELLRNPMLMRGLCAIFAVAPIFGIALAWGAKYLNKTFDIAQADVGRYLWLPPVVFDVAAVAFGHLASKQHRPSGAPPRALFAIGMLLAASLVLLPSMTDPWHAVYLVGIAMAGGGIVYTLATADLLQRMPAGSVSFAAGAMAAAQSLSLVIVNPLIGKAVDHYGNYDVAAIAVGGWALPGCLAWLLWRPKVDTSPLPEARLER